MTPMPPSAAAVPGAAGDRSRLPLVATAAVFVVLAARQVAFVHRYAVDVLFWDSWELYTNRFVSGGWWAAFDQQYGPHRQGLGGLLIRVMAVHSRWDTRWDAAAVSGSLIAAVPLGVWLAWRCGVRGWPLVGVPVAYLNARQYTMFIASANPAHGALPVLLLTGLCLSWFARPVALRLTLVAGLTGVLIFTGFGLFAGLLTPPLLWVERSSAVRRGDRRHAAAVTAALVVTLLAWVAFAHGWRSDTATDRFHFPPDRPVECLYFVGVLLGNAVGVGAASGSPAPVAVATGLAIAAVAATVCVTRGRRALRAGVSRDPASVAIFCLAAFGLLFATQAAVGRMAEGWRSGTAPRYVTLCIPLLLAILLDWATSAASWRRRAAIGFVLLLAAGTTVLWPADRASAAGLSAGCLRWRAAYLATHDQLAADRRSGFTLSPVYDLNPRLDFLRRRQLNLFDPSAFPGGSGGRPHTPPGTGGR